MSGPGYRVRKRYGDREFETHDMAGALHVTGTGPGIQIRKNAWPCRRQSPGGRLVSTQGSAGASRVGLRGLSDAGAVRAAMARDGGIFSGVKRWFGGSVVARFGRGWEAEGYPKLGVCGELREYGEAHVGRAG